MALDFPNAPTIGQKYPQPPVAGTPTYTWDGAKWATPVAAVAGKTAVLTDGSVPMAAGLTLVTPPVNATDAASKGYVDGQITATKVYADAKAYSYPLLNVNAGMTFSQEVGTAAVSGGIAYICDGAMLYANGPIVSATWAPILSGAYGGVKNQIAWNVQTPNASLAATASAFINFRVEGLRTARLAWGTPYAQPITIGFFLDTTYAGSTVTLSVRNGADNRSYLADIQIGVGNNFHTVTVPGDTAGTWATDNGVGLDISICFGVGSSLIGAPGVWNSGNLVGTANTTNGVASTANNWWLTGFFVIPGTVLPPQGNIGLILPPYDQELLDCSRYFQWNRFREPGFNLDSTSRVVFIHTPLVPYRITPTVSLATTTINFECLPWQAAYYVSGAAVNAAHITATGGDYMLTGTFQQQTAPGGTWANITTPNGIKFDARL